LLACSYCIFANTLSPCSSLTSLPPSPPVQPVLNSRGELRPNTAGGAARALFARLPGVGQVLALSWFESGCTSIDDVMQLAQPALAGPLLNPDEAPQHTSSTAKPSDAPPAAAVDSLTGMTNGGGGGGVVFGTPAVTEAVQLQPGAAVAAMPAAAAAGGAGVGLGSSSSSVPGGLVSMSHEALYSLRYSADLLEDVSGGDVQEMQGVVLQGLREITGGTAAAAAAAAAGDWRVELVGGGRRRKSVHDADFLVSHPTLQLEGEGGGAGVAATRWAGVCDMGGSKGSGVVSKGRRPEGVAKWGFQGGLLCLVCRQVLFITGGCCTANSAG